MQATETIALGALAVRLSDRIESVAVATIGTTASPAVAFGRDASALINRYYSAQMEWNEAYAAWRTVEPYPTTAGQAVCILVHVKGGGKE